MPRGNQEALLLQNLRRFLKQGSSASQPEPRALRFEPFRPLPPSGGVEWPSSVFGKVGSAGVGFLQSLLMWWPVARISAQQALSHAFLQCDSLSGSWRNSPPATWGSKRHPWTMLHGIISEGVLGWLREDLFTQLDDLKGKAQAVDPLSEGGKKYRLAGKMVEDPHSQSMNRLKIADWLPTPRLRAWGRAFKHANSQALSRMTAEAKVALKALPAESLGRNGLNFLAHDWSSWFASAGELHIFENAGSSKEEAHYDGGAAILLIAITLYGRRALRIHDDASSQLEPNVAYDLGMGPGCLYMGLMTGPKRQILHSPSLGPEELLGNHGAALILRTTLFPHDRSRGMKSIPSPDCVFTALTSRFLQSLLKEKFVLPSLQQCTASFH